MGMLLFLGWSIDSKCVILDTEQQLIMLQQVGTGRNLRASHLPYDDIIAGLWLLRHLQFSHIPLMQGCVIALCWNIP